MVGSRESIVVKVAWISLVSNIILTVGKVSTGLVAHSDALFADGIHSAADVFASVIVLLVIKFASQPADDEHPYGHGKAEVIVSGLVGLILLLVSLYIIVEAISGLFHEVRSPQMVALWAALISYVAKIALYRTSINTAEKHHSKAIEAIALDHKADIVASLAAAIGILVSVIGAKFDITVLLYGDLVAGIFVSYLIFKIARTMLVDSFDILLDRMVDQDMLDAFKVIIRSFPEVRRIDGLRAREHGQNIYIDLRISIMHDKSIKQGHDLAREIKTTLMERHPNVKEVLIHLNPYFEEV